MGPIARRSTRGYVLQAAATLAGSGSSESVAARRGAQSVSPRAHLVIVCWGVGSVPAESSPPGEARGGTGCKGAHHRSRYSPFRHWLKAHCARKIRGAEGLWPQGPPRFQMAETTCQPQFEDPHHLEWLIRRLSAPSIWARICFFGERLVRSWRRVLWFRRAPPGPSRRAFARGWVGSRYRARRRGAGGRDISGARPSAL